MAVVETLEIELRGRGIENLIAALNRVAEACERTAEAAQRASGATRRCTQDTAQATDASREQARQMVDTSTALQMLIAKYNDAVEKLAQMIQGGRATEGQLASQTEKCQRLARAIRELNEAAGQEPTRTSASDAAAQRMVENITSIEILRAKYQDATARLSEMIHAGRSSEGELAAQAEKCQKLARAIEDLKNQSASASRQMTKFGSTIKSLPGFFSKLAKSIARIAFYRAIRSLIKAITDGISTGLENVYRYSQLMGTTFATAMDNMSTKAYTMKNQLGAAFAGLLSAIMPILLKLINLVTMAANAITQLFAAFSGSATYLKANDTFKAWKDTATSGAAAAKEWKNQLLGFDEINRLEEPASSSGGGGSALPDYSSMFEETEVSEKIKAVVEWIQDHLEEIKNLAIAIGLAILAWDAINLLTQLPSILGSLGSIGGKLLFIAGLALAIYEYMDMWQNGIDWKNLTGFIAGVAAAALALYITFGTVAAVIALVAGGVALLIVGFKEWIETGNLSTEAMTAIVAGLLLIGGGLALVLGWIPLVVAAVAAAVVVIIKYWDQIAAFIGKAVNKIIDFLNWLISGFNAVNEFFGGNPGYVQQIQHVSWGAPAYATGGFPEDGMFFANSGELVGQFDNGRTAVANNEQIIAGIRQGVYEATLAAINNGNLPTAQDVRESRSEVYLDGSMISKSLNKHARAMGT